MKLQDILNANNIAEVLNKTDTGKNELGKIASQVNTQFTNDLQSRSDKQELLKNIVKFALNVTEGKAFPWENASNVIFPLTSIAAIEFNSKAYPEICRDDFVVKAKTYGKDGGEPMTSVVGKIMIDPTTTNSETKQGGMPFMQNVGLKEKRGARVSEFMNWQLNEDIDDWEENEDKLLLALPIVGMMFKKTYWDEDRKKVASELVYPDKLIINNAATSLNKAPFTHIIELYTHEIQKKIKSGYYQEFIYDEDNTSGDGYIEGDISNVQNAGQSQISSNLQIFLEQSCWYDLDDDGFLEPYSVTIHKLTNQVVRMVKRFDKSDIVKNKKGHLQEIKPVNIFTATSFIPSPDGSYYSIGFGQLLFNINKTINSNINQLVDAGTLQNTGGGFISKSLKIAGGNFKFRPGEYKQVDNFGAPLRDSFAPFQAPEPSQTLFLLLGFLVDAGKELGSLKDIIAGDKASNMAPGVMMALVEQGAKQFRPIFKRVYLALKKEFKLIAAINAEKVSNKKYAEVLDEDIIKVDVKADFTKKGFNIVPVADISSITHMQRMAQGAFLMQFLQDPYIDAKENRKRILKAHNIEDIDKLIVDPPAAPPDMGVILAQAEQDKAANRAKEVEIKSIQLMSEIEDLKIDKEKKIAEIEKLRSEAMKNVANAAANDKEIKLKTIIARQEGLRKDIEAAANIQGKHVDRQIKRQGLIEQPTT